MSLSHAACLFVIELILIVNRLVEGEQLRTLFYFKES